MDTSSQLDVDQFSFPTDVDMQLKICTNLYLKAFTLHGQNWIDIRVVLANHMLNGLERLSLYWQRTNWQRGAFGLPSPRHMSTVTSRFTQLQALYLHTTMLGDDLLVNLAGQGRPPFQELGIVVSNDEYDNWLQHFEASSWTKLHNHSSCLQVHLKVVPPILDEVLHDFLIPEMAITSISFVEGAGYGDICTIADMFYKTLRKFVGATDSWRPGGQLMHLVSTCCNLVHFEYTGPLWDETIRELARMRGRRHFLCGRWAGTRLGIDHQ